jgi:hypothetical protein
MKTTLLILAAITAVVLGLSCVEQLAFAQAGSGSAATVVPPDANVLDNPADSLSTIAKLWSSGAITSACIVLAFLVLIVLRSRVPWFSEGWRAVWIAALIGGLGFLVDAIQNGAAPSVSMIMIALTTTLATALRMPPKAA